MSALFKICVELAERLAPKLLALLLLASAAMGKLVASADTKLADQWIAAVVARAATSAASRRILTYWLALLWDACRAYWLLLVSLVATSLVLAIAGHVPLIWRAIGARRRSIFVSFQNRREHDADELGAALERSRFHALRVPYSAGAEHQSIVTGVNDLLRRADAVVCLPGQDASFVEAEVAAATVARKPVVFLLTEEGTLPNTADKQHPSFRHEATSAQRYEPLVAFLHQITQDFRSACLLYRGAWLHPAVGSTLVRVALGVVGASVALCLCALVQGHLVTAQVAMASAPEAEALRVKAVLYMAVSVLLGALILLPVATWLALVTKALAIQLHAARRATLRMRTGQFSRDDWIGLAPGLRPGEPIYEAMLVAAPKAHHEVG